MYQCIPVLLALGLFSQSISFIQCTECIDAPQSMYRTFKSLVDYQGNKDPFDITKGNYVKFENGPIDSLPKNSFVTMDSEHILKLLISNHQISVIEDGAFLSLNCVTTLDLSMNSIETIGKNAFEGLRHLHVLDLSQNKLSEVPERVFKFNSLLKKLNLSMNGIKVLHPDSFYKLILLEELNISFNYLHKIIPDTYQYFDNLINLQMSSNEFEFVEMEQWKNLSNLRVLNLSNNQLKSVDFLYHFSFESNLTELYLHSNFLTRLNAVGLRKHLPFLRIIDISKNPWLCVDLLSILSVFNDSRIGYNSSETSIPNYSGIACNQSMEEYTKDKWTEPIIISSTTTTTTSASHIVEPDNKSQVNATNKILDSISNLHTLIVCLFVVISVFFVIEVLARCGWFNALSRRRGRSPILDDGNVEDISLLRGRF